VMPFGLTNAPACFQHFMNNDFRDLIGKCIVVYFDDVFIYSATEIGHIADVRLVLSRLEKMDFMPS
jgi:hypothetical protein